MVKTSSIIVLCLLIAAALFPPGGAMAAEPAGYKRSIETYTAPDVVLVNQHGKKVKFKELVGSKKPVILDFIYGTCTTICPVLSAGYSNLQQKLGADSGKVQLVSVSIDPENDTPQVMREYLARYHARPGWDFLTGSRSDIDKVMRAYSAWIPNKMSHYPLTLIRSGGEDKWVRLYGILSTAEFMEEYKKAIK